MTPATFVRDDAAVATMPREARIEYLAPYARAIAIRHCRTNGVMDELGPMISDAYLGAIAAVDTWDGTRSLSGWASYKIPRAMLDAFRIRTQRGKVSEFETLTNAAPGDSSDRDGVTVLHTAHPQHPRHEADADQSTTNVVDLLSRLADPRHTYVMTEVFLKDRERKDVAADLGVTPSRVSQLIARASSELREALTDAA